MSSRYNPPSVSDTAYDATAWDGVTSIGPSKNVVRDKLENIAASTVPVVNVKGYGAVGDGVTDDTPAIQTLIDTVPVPTVIYFPVGVYIVSGLKLKSNMTLRGAGSGGFGLSSFWDTRCSVLRHKAGSTLPLIGDYATGSLTYSIVIEDLQLDGNKANQTTGLHGVQLYDAASGQDPAWTIDRCLIRNCKGDGINQGTFRRGLHVFNTHIDQCDGHGIQLNATDNAVAFCFINRCSGVGIDITKSTQHLTSNDVFGCLIGLRTSGGVHAVMVVSCVFDLNMNQGALLAGARTALIGCRFASNSTSGNGAYAHIDFDFPNTVALSCSVIGCIVEWEAASTPNKASYGILTNVEVSIHGLMFNRSTLPFTTGSVNTSALSMLMTTSQAISDGLNLSLGATSGTKIGTATTQKLGFYNATPVVQGASVADATDAATAITQLNALISRIEALGLIATV